MTHSPNSARPAERRPSTWDDDKAAALETAKRAVERINAREAERLRLADVKRQMKAQLQKRGYRP